MKTRAAGSTRSRGLRSRLAAEAHRRRRRRAVLPVALVAAEAALGAPAGAAGHRVPEAPEVEVRLHQPRDDEPVLRADAVRRRRRGEDLDVSYTWSGSTKADVGEMINAFNAAISAKADGIAVCVVDKAAFEAPIKRALGRGIPVVAYNADGARAGAKARQAYIGQDLYVSGFEMGKRIVELVPSGDVAIFIATPGALNIQPRIDGALAAIKQSGQAREGEGHRYEPGPRHRALDDRRVLHRPQEPEGHVRGRRRRHPGRRPGDPEVQAAGRR